MRIRLLKSFLFALMASVTLSAFAQEVLDRPLQGRRGVFRPEWALCKAPQAQDRGPGGNYFIGEKHQLVVLASFADNPFLGDSAATMAQWNKILNTEHLNEAPFTGSFHDYFAAQSYGRFNLICDVHYVRVDSCFRYGSTYTDDENSQYLVQDIMDALRHRNIEWNLYDWNGDGYVNQLLIIFAGQASKYAGLGPRTDAIWPHQWWLSRHLKERKQGVYCSPDTICYQGADFIIDAYCAVQELWKDSTYGSFGTLCHEYTHCFGFPDLYYGSNTSAAAEWDLMDYGNYSGNGFTPPSYSSHERWLMGWLTPVELTQPTEVTAMPALEDAPTAYLVRNDAHPEEFYLLENRQQKGWDAALPGSGMLIAHVDYVPEYWLSGVVNTANAQHYVLMRANHMDSRTHSSGWAYPYVNGSTYNDALTNTSTPAARLWHANTDSTLLMSKPITDIAVTDGLVSFSFMLGPAAIDDIHADTKAVKVLRNGQIYILRGERIYTLQGMEVR